MSADGGRAAWSGGPILRAAAILVILVSLAAPLRAQSPSEQDAAVVAIDAQMYYLKDTSRTPIRLLPSGTAVRIVQREGNWYLVVYTDPRYGDERGYVLASVLRSDGGGPLGSGSGSGAISQRGFMEARAFGFPQTVPYDTAHGVGDFLVREDIFVSPARWFQLAIGGDLRANTHDQVEDEWRLNLDDRGTLRPKVSLRRLTAAVTTSHFTLDIGKQFIRWGRADIMNPTDRFAPRDYLTVIDNEYLPVIGVRSAVRLGNETFEGVWLSQMTPSRLPLLDQRWSGLPPDSVPGFTIEDRGGIFPEGSQSGGRWLHSGRFELGASFFDGFNHLPSIDADVDLERSVIGLTRSYLPLRTVGVELSIPTSVVTIKSEAAYFGSPTNEVEEYVLYVIEAERQVGEWIFDGGYVGEQVTSTAPGVPFGAERGVGKSLIGRVAYTIGPRRNLSVEGAVRQNGDGYFVKGEFSEALSQHLRFTLTGVGIGGEDADFFGQYRRNNHVSAALRFSF